MIPVHTLRFLPIIHSQINTKILIFKAAAGQNGWKLYFRNALISDVTQLLSVCEIFLTCTVFLLQEKAEKAEVRLDQIYKSFFLFGTKLRDVDVTLLQN